jgi:hypothetical protein
MTLAETGNVARIEQLFAFRRGFRMLACRVEDR